jgi:hypothetical protein
MLVDVNGGTLRIEGATFRQPCPWRRLAAGTGPLGGDAAGAVVTIRVAGGGSILGTAQQQPMPSNLVAFSQGCGGSEQFEAERAVWSVFIEVADGTVDVRRRASARRGFGGGRNNGASGAAGDGVGGEVRLSADNAASVLIRPLVVEAIGSGGTVAAGAIGAEEAARRHGDRQCDCGQLVVSEKPWGARKRPPSRQWRCWSDRVAAVRLR